MPDRAVVVNPEKTARANPSAVPFRLERNHSTRPDVPVSSRPMIDVRTVTQPGRSDLAERLRPPVQVGGVRRIVFPIPAALAIEHAIGADVDQPDAAGRARTRQQVRVQRVDGNRLDGVLGRRQLLDDADAVDDGVGSRAVEGGVDVARLAHVDSFDGAVGVAQPGGFQRGRHLPHRGPGLQPIAGELPELVAQHAPSAEHQ